MRQVVLIGSISVCILLVVLLFKLNKTKIEYDNKLVALNRKVRDLTNLIDLSNTKQNLIKESTGEEGAPGSEDVKNNTKENDSSTNIEEQYKNFVDSNGNFYLGSGSGALGAGYFAWNNTDKSLLISGSGVDIQVDTFYLGRTGQYISGSGGNIEISSSTFHLERDGDLTMQGNVTASNIMINGNAKIQ